jgi:hypothetical protein
MDGLSRKAYGPNNVGVIPDVSDETWLLLIKEKVVASFVTKQTKRTICKPKRYCTNSESDTEVKAHCKAKGKSLPKHTAMDPLIGGQTYQPKPEPVEQDHDRDILLRTPSPFQPDGDEPQIDLFYHKDNCDHETGNNQEIQTKEKVPRQTTKKRKTKYPIFP